MTATVTIRPRDLATTLQYMRKAIALRKSHPEAYHAVTLTTEDGALIVRHTGWEHIASARVAAEDAVAGAFTVAVRIDQLLDAARSAARDTAAFTLSIAPPSGNLIARAGTMSAIVPSIMDKGTVGPYPNPAPLDQADAVGGEGLRITGAALAELVGAVAVAACTDLTLPDISGVKITHDGEGNVTAQATDRYRLMTATAPAHSCAPDSPALSILAPAAWIAETTKLMRGDREVTMTTTQRAGHVWLTLSGDSGVFSVDCPTAVERFPRVEQLFREHDEADAVFTVNAAAWAKAVKAWKGSSIRLHVEGGNIVQAERHPGGDMPMGKTEATGEMALQVTSVQGEPITAQFTAELLASILATAPRGAEATVRINAPNRPAQITWGLANHLLMTRRFVA